MTKEYGIHGYDLHRALSTVPSLGCVFAFIYLLVFQATSFSYPNDAALSIHVLQVLVLVFSATMSFVFCLVARTRDWLSKAFGPLLTALIPAFLLLSCWLLSMICELIIENGIHLRYACWFVIGLALPIQLYCSIQPFGSLEQRSVPFVIGSANLFGAVIYYSVTTLGFYEGIPILAVLSGWSASFSNSERWVNKTASKDMERGSDPRSSMPVYPRSFRIAVVLYAMVFGTMIPQIVMFNGEGWLAQSTIAIISASVIICIYSILRHGAVNDIRKGSPQRAIAAFVIVGYLPLAIFGPSAAWFCCLFFTWTFSLYLIVDLSSRVMMRVSDIENTKVLAVRHQSLMMFGLAIGVVVETAVSLVSVVGYVNIVSFVALGLTVVLVLIIALTPSPDLLQERPLPEQTDESQRWNKACDSVVQHYKLTRREAEVLHLLAKRASTKAIQEKLVISPHTVESHVHNIYKKLNVNSKDETIALIESFLDSQ